ncbi:MAG TPA: FAD-binding oxidoreductase [Longimicrobiales bacterium]|nr:FAD-binding oxidoreductase [Longimicrobiales bacterium]
MTGSRENDGQSLPEKTDVLVIGGGIAGTSTLYHLARNGVEATLVEKGQVGMGATEAAVGVLSPPLRQPFHETAHDRGADMAREIWDFALRSMAGLGEALTGLGAATEAGLDLRGGHLLAEPHSVHQVRLSFEALEAAGFPVRWLSPDEVEEACGGRGFSGGYFLEGGGAISPGATARALARGAAEAGARVVEGVTVEEVTRRNGSLVCETDDGTVTASMVVYATHVDSRRFSALVGDEIVPIRGQGLAAEVEGLPEQAGCFSTHWKLNVWRQAPEGTLFLGGWRHDAWDRSYWKTRPELDGRLQDDLERWFHSVFPRVRFNVVKRWSGIFGWTSDYLPLVGPLPGAPDELVISGFSGGGLPFAFECGRVLAHAVAGRDAVAGGSLFNPRRFL